MAFPLSVLILSASHLQPKDASCSMTFWYILVVILLEKPVKGKGLKHYHKSNLKNQNYEGSLNSLP